MDPFTREIVVWNVSGKQATELVGNALIDALITTGHLPKTVP